jgi:CDP-paratose 2-epimerase
MPSMRKDKWTLITGGAGFIGANLAHRLLSEGKTVLILDNLSRPGVERNLNWLCATHGERVKVQTADIINSSALRKSVSGAEAVFHFAAQVAVTTSIENPLRDFEVNLRGTVQLLELLRMQSDPPPLLFTSTNKVYGKLNGLELLRGTRRYEPVDSAVRTHGISEACPLDFRSPYGCSKGAADQYVLDYGRIYRLPTVVFRMSCIYGPRQFGTEDQGWVAHLLIQALNDQPIVLYGDGRQVRDVLFVDDLVDALVAAVENIGKVHGEAYNIGGGPQNVMSLMELIQAIETLSGKKPRVLFADWRTEDQKYYVSDIGKFSTRTGWTPRVDVREGVRKLWDWLDGFIAFTNGKQTAEGQSA